jgi:hypothetical protein
MIGRPPSTILDRSIVIELRRRTPDEPITRLRQDQIDDELLPLRRQWRRWIDDHAGRIGAADPHVPTSLHDRAADCWRPLAAIADLAGGDWPTRARAAAVALSGGDVADDESITVGLLADVRTIYDVRDVDILTSEDLTAALVAMTDRPWADWSRGRPLTQARLARLLKPFGIVPVPYRHAGRQARGYRRAQWLDTWARYLSDPPDPPDDDPLSPPPPDPGGSRCHTVTTPMFTGSDSLKSKCHSAVGVTLSKPAIGSMNTGPCDGVTVRSARSGPPAREDADPALRAEVEAVTSPLSDWGLDDAPKGGPYGC